MSSLCKGKVYLVGAGPGDPGLITVRGLECLQQAEVVIHDRLVSRALFNYARRATLIDVGKQPDRHPVSQANINQVLVEQAQAGKIVVRLKGGDPFVFGRGGEEALALVEAGIPFEIVPGVTSAVAAPAYAGIPITHRGLACSAVMITGHRAACSEEEMAEWRRAATGGDTLVFLMGVHNLPQIVEQLKDGGLPLHTPVALVEQATCATQKTATGTLADIVEKAVEIRPPAVIVVGRVVMLREKLRWFDSPDQRPLLGLRILNTRPSLYDVSPTGWQLDRYQPAVESPLGFRLGCRDEFSQRLAGLGAEPVELPALAISPTSDTWRLDEILLQIVWTGKTQPMFDWIVFPDAHAVWCFFKRLKSLGYDARALAGIQMAGCGDRTAQAMLAQGVRPDYISERHATEDLAEMLKDIREPKILVPQSDRVERDLIQALAKHNSVVEPLVVYCLRPAELDPSAMQALYRGEIEAATFFSPAALEGLAEMLPDRKIQEVLEPIKVACIGPATTKVARRLGVRVDIVSRSHCLDAMCQALQDYFQQNRERVTV